MKKQLLFPLFALIYFFSCNLFSQINQNFTLVNKTGITIYKLFVAPVTDSEHWGPNLLEEVPLKNKETIEVSFNKSDFPDDCLWDIKVIDKYDNSMSWYDTNLCRYSTITLHWDENKGKGWAEFE